MRSVLKVGQIAHTHPRTAQVIQTSIPVLPVCADFLDPQNESSGEMLVHLSAAVKT